MKLLKHFVFGLLGLLMLAMVAIYLTPLDAYVPEVEQAFSDQLHEPRQRLCPRPRPSKARPRQVSARWPG